MLYRMKSGCDKSSYTGTKNYLNALQDLSVHKCHDEESMDKLLNWHCNSDAVGHS